MLMAAATSIVPVFEPQSPQAQAILDLFVMILYISAGIFAIVAGLILISLIRFRARDDLPVQEFGSHRKEIFWLLGPVIIVIWIGAISAKLVLTLSALPKADPVALKQAPRIEVRGHQWFWEFRYLDADVTTSSELVIPVGEPMRIQVESNDVIHCFWVPQLARKIDAIPGWTNHIWLQADKPGVYQGRCAEYCGTQHAWMNFQVRAVTPDEYKEWLRQQQVVPGAAPAGELAAAGKDLFLTATCVDCHTVRGTPAKATIGPDLTHVATRTKLGSGVLDNSPENLRSWLKNPQAHKPGCKMPNFNLTDKQVDQLATWLESLK